MSSDAGFAVGALSGEGAVVNGRRYDRVGATPYVPQGVGSIMVMVGRTPVALAAGGYEDPGERTES